MSLETRRIKALLLLLIAITGMMMAIGESVVCAGELPGAHETAVSIHGHDSQQVHDSSCPSAPSRPQSSDDHVCVDDCGCPCHAPLPATSLKVNIQSAFSLLGHAEPRTRLPEVYLSLFVPPDSANA